MKRKGTTIRDLNGILFFMKEGKSLEGVSIGDPIKMVIDIHGKPYKIIGDDFSGFYEFKNGLRYRYVDDYIDEIGIIFNEKTKNKFKVKVDLLEEIKFISRDIAINNFLMILSYFNIKWRSWDEQSLSVFSIRTEADVLILFELETGKLNRIIYLGEGLKRLCK